MWRNLRVLLYLFTLAPGDLNNRATVVFPPLSFAARNRFNPAVAPGGDAPEQVYIIPVPAAIKTGRNHEHIDIAHGIRLALSVRTEYDSERHIHAIGAQCAQITPNTFYN
jgi:hypothetical protein